jgi:hypothetical protein
LGEFEAQPPKYTLKSKIQGVAPPFLPASMATEIKKDW